MNKLTGGRWSLGKADLMRKVKDLEGYRQDFVECCSSNGVPERFANGIFDRFDLGYTFNKSHAASYAVITALCAWFKYHYRPEFMSAAMSIQLLGDVSELPVFIKECRKYGIKIIPPNINKSGKWFECVNGEIIYPFTGIKQVGNSAIGWILEKRGTGFQSLDLFFNVMEQKYMRKNVMENLIKAGCFDCFGINRLKMLKIYLATRKEQYPLEIFTQDVLMSFERESLGMCLSRHPMEGYSVIKLSEFENGTQAVSCGIVTEVKVTTDKNGNKMAFFTIENVEENIECVCFARAYKKYAMFIATGMKLQITGKRDRDKILVDEIHVIH
jgi:DNA polymerase-3 subunit alpha